MSFAVEDFLNKNSGISNNTTNHVIDLGQDGLGNPIKTTAGSAVVIVCPGGTPPAGQGFLTYGAVHVKPEVAADETSWTFTSGSAMSLPWVVEEVRNVDPVEPLDINRLHGGWTNVANNATLAVGPTGKSMSLGVAAYCVWWANHSSATTETASFDTFTNGFEEIAQVNPTSSVSSGTRALAVTRLLHDGTPQVFSTGATFRTSLGGLGMADLPCDVVVLRCADERVTRAYNNVLGFNWLTHWGGGEGNLPGGYPSGGAATGMLGGSTNISSPVVCGTNYLIASGVGRNGAPGLRWIPPSSGAMPPYIPIGNLSTRGAGYGGNFKAVNAPSGAGTVTVGGLAGQLGSTIAGLFYDCTTNKYGVQAGMSGTIVWQSGTCPVGADRYVELRVKTTTSTYRVEWRVEDSTGDMIEQTAATGAGTAGTNILYAIIGGSVETGVEFVYSHMYVSAAWSNYPVLPAVVLPALVDAAASPTIIGTTANFGVFNGSIAAWAAATARTYMRTAPPQLTGNRQAVMQTTTATGDYAEFTFAPPADDVTKSPVAVRSVFAACDGTGAGTGTLGLFGWDGTTETPLADAALSYDADSLVPGSATNPWWRCSMWQITSSWTWNLIRNLKGRMGKSNDATPDKGGGPWLLEILFRDALKLPAVRVTDPATDEEIIAQQYQHPETGGIQGIIVNVPTGRTAKVTWNRSGSIPSGADTSPQTVAAAVSPKTLKLWAETLDEITDLTLEFV